VHVAEVIRAFHLLEQAAHVVQIGLAALTLGVWFRTKRLAHRVRDLPALCCLYHKRLPVHHLYGICRLCESFNKVINNNKLINELLLN